MKLSDADRDLLLQHARSAVSSEFTPEQKTELPERFNQPGASFVTLTINGNLRGCIGSLHAQRALAEDIWHNARAAAFSDPRFPALSAVELENTQFEISILSEPEKVKFSSEQELFQTIKPLIDGIIIESGFHRATFLPQVWQQLPTHRAFFSRLLQKAGLDSNAPLTDLTIYRYQVEKFTE